MWSAMRISPTNSKWHIVYKNLRKPCIARNIPVAAYSTRIDEDQVLHRSVLPTDHFQRSLPRLPIPKLEDTCRRYLNAQKPILTDEEYKRTEKIVQRFKEGEGQAIHNELVALDKQNKHTSYISAPWYDYYLKDRRSVVINHNPFMAYKDDPNAGYNNQLIRATNFVVSSMKFMKTLRANILEPELFHLNPKKSDTPTFRKVMKWMPNSVAAYGAIAFKAFPLDMSQFPRLFNTNRIPRLGKDELYTDEAARHLMVMRKGHIYVFDVLDKDGNILPATEVMANLKYILEDTRPPPEYPLGICTTKDRESWAKLRTTMEESGNMEQLRKIDGAFFTLVLDDESPKDPIDMSRQFLHGTESTGTNRWHDKSFSLLVAGDGKSSVTFEHAWGDGVAVLRYFNEVYQESTTAPKVHPDTQPANIDPSSKVQLLEFNLTDDAKQGIKEAEQDFKKKIASLDMNYIVFDHFGKKFIKQQKLSPDSFMQLAIQIAFYRQYGKTVASYESCSTSAFKHGRTETIRPATMATKKTSEMFEQTNPRPSTSELRACMEECSKVHGQLTKEAAMGQGFDRHLFAMKYLLQSDGRPLPELYTDPAYTTINHIICSTSTLSSPAIEIGGFCPVVPDGFGIGYGLRSDKLGFIVSAYHKSNSVNDFLDCMQQTLDDMHTALEGRDFKH